MCVGSVKSQLRNVIYICHGALGNIENDNKSSCLDFSLLLNIILHKKIFPLINPLNSITFTVIIQTMRTKMQMIAIHYMGVYAMQAYTRSMRNFYNLLWSFQDQTLALTIPE